MIRPLALLAAAMALASAAQGQAPAPARAGSAPRAPADIYARTCAQCHGATGWGTRALARRVAPEEAELLRRTSIPADYVRAVVRHGIGSMPQFTPTDLSDAELDGLARWLERRR